VPQFLILTLGCKLNQLESEAVVDMFTQAGFSEYRIGNEKPDSVNINNVNNQPDIVIINTCTVTSKADQKARRAIRKALRDYPEACVIVTGCYAQLNREDILKLDTDGRLFIIDRNDILALPQYINQGTGIGEHESRDRELGTGIGNILNSFCAAKNTQNQNSLFQFNPNQFSRHTRAYLKIQDGCDKHCTYCKIRLARGKSVSLEEEEVLSRLRTLEKTHAEAVLTGVNISQYFCSGIFYRKQHEPEPQTSSSAVLSQTEKGSLAELLDYLLSGTEKIAIRLSSLAPDVIDENLAGILSHPRIRPHFHLSVQSLSDKILNKMRRTYKNETVESAIALIRRVKDDPFIACDIITGFPGETQEDFDQTFNLCKKLDFAWIHVFPYSKRQGTPAFLFSDTVTESEITKRVKKLTELAKQGRSGYARRWLGKEVDVLIENSPINIKKFTQTAQTKNGLITGQNCFCGTSENYLKTLVECEGNTPEAGTALRCKLNDIIENNDLFVTAQPH